MIDFIGFYCAFCYLVMTGIAMHKNFEVSFLNILIVLFSPITIPVNIGGAIAKILLEK